MTLTLKRAVLAVVALAAVGAGSIYLTAKPYQQDRILIELGLKAR